MNLKNQLKRNNNNNNNNNNDKTSNKQQTTNKTGRAKRDENVSPDSLDIEADQLQTWRTPVDSVIVFFSTFLFAVAAI